MWFVAAHTDLRSSYLSTIIWHEDKAAVLQHFRLAELDNHRVQGGEP